MLRAALAIVAILAAAAPAAAQKITVKSATPNNGAQGSVDLDVAIAGNGFGPGAKAEFLVSGTANPGGIRVKSTRFVSSSQLVATVDIDDAASLAIFDIKVSLNGRSGKGTDLFQVVEKVAACEAGTYSRPYAPQQLTAWAPDQACGVGAGGSLDCTFGNGGQITSSAVPAPGRIIRGAVTEPDGALLVLLEGRPAGASADTAASSFYLMRFTADGAVSGGFGTNGVASVVFSGVGWERPAAIVRQPDGRIVVAGRYQVNRSGQYRGAIARFLPNGTLDPSFGSGGRVSVTFGLNGSSSVSGLVVLPDGKLIAGGSGNGTLALARLHPNGILDASFGTAGSQVLSLGASSGDQGLTGLALQTVQGQTRLVLAGSAKNCSQALYSAIVVARLSLQGALDSSFGPTQSGATFVQVADGGTPTSLVVDSDNRLVVAGYSRGATAVTRLNADGTLDEGFGANGVVLTQVDGLGAGLMSSAVDSEGRILVAGWHSQTSSDRDFLVERYLADGTLDPTFGLAGAGVTTFAGGQWAGLDRAIVVQPGGRIVVVGTGAGTATGYQLIAVAGYVP